MTELIGFWATEAVKEIQNESFADLAAQLFRLCCYDDTRYFTEEVEGGKVYKWDDGSSCFVPTDVSRKVWGG
jgi:hypothetical protein